jgi:hypothetical protein
MSRNRFIRRTSANRWNSATSRRANKARWDADRARRDAEIPERIAEIREIEAINLPRNQGDMLGVLQWSCANTGKVRRWTIRIGDRRDRIKINEQNTSRGWTWFLAKLRKHLLTKI